MRSLVYVPEEYPDRWTFYQSNKGLAESHPSPHRRMLIGMEQINRQRRH
jgi:hypothetical protein